MQDDTTRIAGVTLAVGALDRARRFYTDVLGLADLHSTADRAELGVDGRGFLHLVERHGKAPADPTRPGLFHVAYRLPAPADLASFAAHLHASGVSLAGASDHGVSEALYLADPDGHGIEVYVDRPRAAWPEDDAGVRFPTRPLDLAALTAAAAPWRGAPAGTVVGHVHLRVADLDAAERAARAELGLTVRHRASGARFFAWDGYHHHLAVNVWGGRAGGAAGRDTLGLEEVRLHATAVVDGHSSSALAGVRWRVPQPDMTV